ncbi:hypothetical protein ACROYT_G036792 [Oculina patagonica]
MCGGAILAVGSARYVCAKDKLKGVPIGVFAGYIISAWVFFGSMFYPPNTNPGVRSVRECPFYQQVLNASRFGNGSNATLDKYGDGLIRNPYKPHSTPIADLYGLSYLWLSGLSFGAATIVSVFASFVLETKQDQLKKVDHMLLFPIKAWLRGFLPGHKFTWEEENDANDEDENEMKCSETVKKRLWLRMARTEMDCNLKIKA